MSPIGPLSWLYGKFFTNHTFLSYVLAIALGGLIAALLWAAAIGRYSGQVHAVAPQTPSRSPTLATQADVQPSHPRGLASHSSPKVARAHSKPPSVPPSSPVTIQQQSTGANSPNTAVVGNNDQVIINPASSKLILTDEQQSEITNQMRPYAGQKVSIFLNHATDDTWEFGSRLKVAFENAQVSVYMTNGIVEVGGGGKPVPGGIAISFSDDRQIMAHAIVVAFTECKLLKIGTPVPRISVPKETRDVLGLIISPSEN